MSNVVLDTNVIISALLTPHGNPARILEMVFSGYLTPCFSTAILLEYESVLSRPKFNLSQEVQRHILNGLDKTRAAYIHLISGSSTIPFADETDRKFYDAARSYDALLITGNIKHYPKESFIFTPTQFLEL